MTLQTFEVSKESGHVSKHRRALRVQVSISRHAMWHGVNTMVAYSRFQARVYISFRHVLKISHRSLLGSSVQACELSQKLVMHLQRPGAACSNGRMPMAFCIAGQCRSNSYRVTEPNFGGNWPGQDCILLLTLRVAIYFPLICRSGLSNNVHGALIVLGGRMMFSCCQMPPLVNQRKSSCSNRHALLSLLSRCGELLMNGNLLLHGLPSAIHD